jgi:hypothetical protein
MSIVVIEDEVEREVCAGKPRPSQWSRPHPRRPTFAPALTQERKRRTIITPTLSAQQMPYMNGYMFIREFPSNDRLSQDRVGRGDTRGDGECREEFDLGEDGPDEECRDDPAPL